MFKIGLLGTSGASRRALGFKCPDGPSLDSPRTLQECVHKLPGVDLEPNLSQLGANLSQLGPNLSQLEASLGQLEAP